MDFYYHHNRMNVSCICGFCFPKLKPGRNTIKTECDCWYVSSRKGDSDLVLSDKKFDYYPCRHEKKLGAYICENGYFHLHEKVNYGVDFAVHDGNILLKKCLCGKCSTKFKKIHPGRSIRRTPCGSYQFGYQNYDKTIVLIKEDKVTRLDIPDRLERLVQGDEFYFFEPAILSS